MSNYEIDLPNCKLTEEVKMFDGPVLGISKIDV